jgi:hypothetical protein
MEDAVNYLNDGNLDECLKAVEPLLNSSDP